MRPQQHLAEITERFGSGDGTEAITRMVTQGLELANLRELEKRHAEGKVLKDAPYVTDVGKCPRAVFFTLRNEPETEAITTDSLVNFKVGHAVEEAFSSLLEPLGGQVIREMRVEIPSDMGVKIRGRADFLVVLPDFRYLIELKSTSSRAMGAMLKNGEAGRDEHRRQLALYLHASQLGLLDTPPLDVGFLVYIVKDATRREPPIHAFKVYYDEEDALGDVADLATLKLAADRNLDPGIPAELKAKNGKHWRCQYCSYKTKCWG